MQRNRGLLRNPRLTSVRATAMVIGAAIIITIATGATITTGRTTTAMATTRRARTAITAVPATMAVAPALRLALAAGGLAGGCQENLRNKESRHPQRRLFFWC